MNIDISKKIADIETLYTEQEYTIHQLNDIVIRQTSDITRLQLDLQQLKQQYESLKELIPDASAGSSNEIPPHY